MAVPRVNRQNRTSHHRAVPKVGPITPPVFSYNPTVAEEGQKALTEEGNRLHEIGREKHYTEHDVATGLRNIKTALRRHKMDYGNEFRRANQKIGRERAGGEEKLNNEQADTEKAANRKLEDFQTRRNNITREFGELAHKQAEAENARGVLDQGTSAAAAAARARRQQQAEEPIDTAEARTREDLATALARLATARGKLGTETDRMAGELAQDYGVNMRRLGQDVGREREELHTKVGRNLHNLGEKEQEVRQAGVEAKQNTLTNEIWEFKENHPAAFAKWAKAHPNAVKAARGERATQAARKIGTPPPSKNGGTQFPRRVRRQTRRQHRRRNR